MHPWRALKAVLAALAALAGALFHSPAPGRRSAAPAPAAASSPAPAASSTVPAAAPSPAPAAPGPRNLPIPVLMYHVIGVPGPRAPWPSLYLSPDLFAAQMRALHGAGYQALTLSQAFAIWDGVAAAPAHPVILSFDDGYTGDATEAAPVLATYGWPGVLCQQVQRIDFPGGLTAAQIRSLLQQGWELADHGVSQPEVDLTTATPAVRTWEIDTSRRDLQAEFGTGVHFFCYPVGHYDPQVVAAVGEAGFVGALTTVPGAADPVTEGPLRLDRIRVSAGESPAALLSVLAAAAAAPPPAPPETVTVPPPAPKPLPRPVLLPAAAGTAKVATSTKGTTPATKAATAPVAVAAKTVTATPAATR